MCVCVCTRAHTAALVLLLYQYLIGLTFFLNNLLVIFIMCDVAVGDPGNLFQKFEENHDGTLLNYVHYVTGRRMRTYCILCRPYIKHTLIICYLKWNVVLCFFFTCALQKYASILSEFISMQ